MWIFHENFMYSKWRWRWVWRCYHSLFRMRSRNWSVWM
jgi:hypothetical protein